LFFSYYKEPIVLISPSTKIAILVHNVSASSKEWVVKINVESFIYFIILFIIFHIFNLAPGSIPLEGSSISIICGFPIKAIATDNFLLFPPESFSAYTFLY